MGRVSTGLPAWISRRSTPHAEALGESGDGGRCWSPAWMLGSLSHHSDPWETTRPIGFGLNVLIRRRGGSAWAPTCRAWRRMLLRISLRVHHHRSGLDSNQRRLPPFGCVSGATPWHCRPPHAWGALPLSHRSDDGPRLSGVSSTVLTHDTSRNYCALRGAGGTTVRYRLLR